MSEVIFIDWSKHPAIGVRTLNHALLQNGIKSGIVKLPQALALQIGQLSRSKYKTKAEEAVEAAAKYMQSKKEFTEAKIICFPMYDWHGQERWDARIIPKIKKLFPQKIIIGGGPAFTSNPSGFFAQLKLDYAIRGEAEKALPQLIKIILGRTAGKAEEVSGIVMRKGGRIIVSTPARISSEEIKNMRMPTMRDKQGLVFAITTRGCAKACIFCLVPRKGNPAQISEENVLREIIKLSKNPAVREINFHDDQLFHDRERAIRIFGKVIELGINNKISFSGLATIDSFITTKNGVRAVDVELINMLALANFRGLEIGTEALSDGMLHELKGGRYTAIEAMQVTKALSNARIRTHHFLLAGGVDTKPIEFLETFYRTLAKDTRRLQEMEKHGNMLIIQAFKGTPIYAKALREGCLVNERGRPAGDIQKNKMGVRFVVPKDPMLRDLFVNQLKKGILEFNVSEIPQVLELARKVGQTNNYANELAERIKKVRNIISLFEKTRQQKTLEIIPHLIEKELLKKGKKFDEKAATGFNNSTVRQRRITTQARRLAELHMAGEYRLAKLDPTKRLRMLKRMREKMGFGATIPTHAFKVDEKGKRRKRFNWN